MSMTQPKEKMIEIEMDTEMDILPIEKIPSSLLDILCKSYLPIIISCAESDECKSLMADEEYMRGFRKWRKERKNVRKTQKSL